jgi:hypothetical protein
LELSTASELPKGFSLVVKKGAWEYSKAAMKVYNDHIHKEPIRTSTFLKGSCTATIGAPGYIAPGCQHET